MQIAINKRKREVKEEKQKKKDKKHQKKEKEKELQKQQAALRKEPVVTRKRSESSSRSFQGSRSSDDEKERGRYKPSRRFPGSDDGLSEEEDNEALMMGGIKKGGIQ